MILLCNPRSDVMMSLTKLIKLVTKYPLTKFCTFLFSLLSMAVFSIRKVVVNLHSFYGFWLNQASRIQKSHFLSSSNSTFFTKFPHAVLLCLALLFAALWERLLITFCKICLDDQFGPYRDFLPLPTKYLEEID